VNKFTLDECLRLNLSNRLDDSGASLGRRYARADELGMPFCITLDFQTLIDNTATLRERDSMLQIRAPLPEILQLCRKMCDGDDYTFDMAGKKYGYVTVAEEEGEVADEKKGKTFVESTARGRFSRPSDM
jgi:glycyl-tRNA synthetase